MYPQAYIEYLAYFHGERDYFECHEVLEDYWKEVDYGNKQSIWVGFIQLAVANYHHRRGNFPGAERTMKKSLRILQHGQSALSDLGMQKDALFLTLHNHLGRIQAQMPYVSYELPITDEKLLLQCHALCQQQGYEWGQKSDLTNMALLFRHSLRDRSKVIEERLLAKEKRQ